VLPVIDDALIANAPDVPDVAADPTDDSSSPVRTWTLPGVYGPQEDSRFLASALRREDLRGARVLDLCTGTGFLAATAARAGASEVVAVDVSRRAALTARLNLWRNGVHGKVRRGDLLRAAPPGTYDVIVSNPPYVPAEDEDVPTRGAARAWDAGTDGRAVIDRICAEAPGRLRPGGRILVVHSHVADVDRTVDMLREQGLDAGVSMRRELAFGPVMRRRADFLRRRSLIDHGDRSEELVVVRAEAPGVPRHRVNGAA
jgi:release factor glutamine methyltransferase